MYILIAISLLLVIGGFAIGIWGDEIFGTGTIGLGLFILTIGLFCATNINFGTQTLTGYIYSSEEQYGYTTAHIRFSEQAGQDVQPSFCVPTNSEAGTEIKKVVGSGKKVTVTIPPYSYFSNNVFACGTDKTVIIEQ